MKKLLISFFLAVPFLAFAIQPTYETKAEGLDILVISLKDNKMPTKLLIPTNKSDEALIQKTYPTGDFVNQHNVMLIKAKKLNILVDTGFPNTQNELLAGIKNAGLKPADITHIILTHGHFDHIGGLVSAEGKKLFPNAKIIVDKNDYDFFLDKQKDETFTKVVNSYNKSISFFPANGEPIPAVKQIKNIPAYGHTPGHNMILIDTKKDPILFVADILHAYDLQSQAPHISTIYDADPKLAAENRKKAIDTYFSKYLITGSHFPWTAPTDLKKSK